MESVCSLIPQHMSSREDFREDRHTPVERVVDFDGLSFDEAVERASFHERHPYIHWPDFGHLESAGGTAAVVIKPMAAFNGSAETLFGRHLITSELAEYVALHPEDAHKPLFALGEHSTVLGIAGYPYAVIENGLRALRLWYCDGDWPPEARVIVKCL